MVQLSNFGIIIAIKFDQKIATKPAMCFTI